MSSARLGQVQSPERAGVWPSSSEELETHGRGGAGAELLGVAKVGESVVREFAGWSKVSPSRVESHALRFTGQPLGEAALILALLYSTQKRLALMRVSRRLAAQVACAQSPSQSVAYSTHSKTRSHLCCELSRDAHSG